MARYYFDVRDGEAFVRVDEGEELLDVADAQIEAAATLADMAKDVSMRASGHANGILFPDRDRSQHALSINDHLTCKPIDPT